MSYSVDFLDVARKIGRLTIDEKYAIIAMLDMDLVETARQNVADRIIKREVPKQSNKVSRPWLAKGKERYQGETDSLQTRKLKNNQLREKLDMELDEIAKDIRRSRNCNAPIL